MFNRYLFSADPKTQSAHERALRLVSMADFEFNLHYFDPEPFPGLPKSHMASKGRK